MQTVLIIEDAPEMRKMLTLFVERMGYEVFEANDGLEGLKLAQALKPALIILDLMMPIASGDLTLGYIRSAEDIKQTPVIVTSAHPKAQQISQDLGANVCLTKPYDFGELKTWIQRLITPLS